MRFLLVFSILLSTLALHAQTATTPEAIIAQENAFWTSYVDGNTAELSKLLLPDFTSVEEQIWNRDQVLLSSNDSMRNVRLRRSRFSIRR